MTSNSPSDFTKVNAESDSMWEALYPLLRSFALYLVFSFKTPAWQGQENDVAEDIVQETMLHLLIYAHKAARGEAAPIRSIEHLMKSIASNYCKDLWRHDRRFIPIPPDAALYEGTGDIESGRFYEECVIEKIYQDWLFMLVAHEVAHFPNKQKEALLIDLANRMSFEGEPTALQEAFHQVEIYVQRYQSPLPRDSRERTQHSSLLSYAYKRLATCFHRQESLLAS